MTRVLQRPSHAHVRTLLRADCARSAPGACERLHGAHEARIAGRLASAARCGEAA